MNHTVYGYSRTTVPNEGPLILKEVTFQAQPDELRRIAAFLQYCAAEMDKRSDGFGHEHLQDQNDLRPWNEDATDIIVAS